MTTTPLVIDLSHYQVIPEDLMAARKSGIAGVIHKATQGLRYLDPKAKARCSLAKDAGMLWGVYHFLIAGNIEAQVKWFLSQRDIIDEDTLLCLDFEVKGVTRAEVLQALQLIEQKSGQEPVLYSGSFIKELGGASGLDELKKYRLWIPQYGSHVTLPKGYDDWWLWQYSDHGTVPGITGPVDVNSYKGTERNLQNDWVKHTGQPEVEDPQPVPDQPPTKPPPDPQVVVRERASAWSKVWAGLCAFFSAVWTTITGWYATDFARPLIDKARDNAANNFTLDLLPQIGLLLGSLIVIGGIALLFLWAGVWIWNHEKARVARLNEVKVEIASDPKKSTVEFTNDPKKASAGGSMGDNNVT